MEDKKDKRVLRVELDDDVKKVSITGKNSEEKVVMRQELNEEELEIVTGGSFDDICEKFFPECQEDNPNSVIIPDPASPSPKVNGFYPLKINPRNLVPGQQLKFWPSVNQFNCPTNS